MKNLILTLTLVSIMISLVGCQANSTPDFNPTPTNLSSILTDGLNGDFIWDLLIQSHDLWTATPVGAYRWNLDTGNYRLYTAKDGLADSYVTSIAQDKQNNLWFGTDKGVSRFDGTHWKTFTTKDGLATDVVTAIAIDKQGSLWFGTYLTRSDIAIQSNGVTRFDGHNWHIYTVKDGLPGNDVFTIFGDNRGYVWLGTSGSGAGATRFDGKHWTTFIDKDGLIQGYVKGIYQDKAGKLWFGTMNGCSNFDGQHWQTIIPYRSFVQNPSVYVIFQDKSGNYWFASDAVGVDRFDGSNWQYFGQPGNTWRSAYINAIAQDSTGNLWFATLGGGLIRFDGTTWKTFSVNPN